MAIISIPSTQEQALERINSQLRLAGFRPISRATLYRLRRVYTSMFPRSQWLNGERLIYGEPVIVFLYFLTRIHLRVESFQLTQMTARAFLNEMPGVKFSDRCPTFSAVDSLFLQQVAV